MTLVIAENHNKIYNEENFIHYFDKRQRIFQPI